MVAEVVKIVSLGLESGLVRIWIHQKNRSRRQERKLEYDLYVKKIFEKKIVRRDPEKDSIGAEPSISGRPKTNWSIGDAVVAKDSFNNWIPGVVKSKDDQNGKRVLVSFRDHSDKWDAWYLNNSKWLKPDKKVL